MFDGESDYVVEHYVKPEKIRVPLINDERADILGNFDDSKLKDTPGDRYQIEDNPFDTASSDGDDDDDDAEGESGNSPTAQTEAGDNDESIAEPTAGKAAHKTSSAAGTTTNDTSSKSLSDTQITNLLRGASKKDRFVLYVTNLSYATSKQTLVDFFSVAGIVKSVRVPKTRKNAFAFIEMLDLEGFKVGIELLSNYTIYDGFARTISNIHNLFLFTESIDIASSHIRCIQNQSSGIRRRKEEIGQQKEYTETEEPEIG